MNLRTVLYHLVHDSEAGAAELERRLKLKEGYLQNAVAPSLKETHHMNALVLEKVLDFIPNGNMEAAKFFAHKANATVIPIPTSLGNVSDMALLDGFMCIVKELGEFSREFQDAWADGRITTNEFEKVRLQAFEMIAAAQVFLERVGELKEEPKYQLKTVS